jgi:hypothetical protein
MEIREDVTVWKHLDPFSNQELMFWYKAYRDKIVPEAEANKRQDPAHYKRCVEMLGGLTLKAAMRGLV